MQRPGIGFSHHFPLQKLYFEGTSITHAAGCEALRVSYVNSTVLRFGPTDDDCTSQPGFCFSIAVKQPVTECNLMQRLDVPRIQLSCPLQISCGLFPASLTPLD